MGYATILGLDLGKFKSVFCVMDAVSGGHAFETLASAAPGGAITVTDSDRSLDV